jgi:hypothetical protein
VAHQSVQNECRIAKHNTTQHNTTQHNTTQHNTTQHNTTQHHRMHRILAQHIVVACRITQRFRHCNMSTATSDNNHRQVRVLVAEAAKQLQDAGIDQPHREAGIMIKHALKHQPYSHSTTLSADQATRFHEYGIRMAYHTIPYHTICNDLINQCHLLLLLLAITGCYHDVCNVSQWHTSPTLGTSFWITLQSRAIR